MLGLYIAQLCTKYYYSSFIRSRDMVGVHQNLNSKSPKGTFTSTRQNGTELNALVQFYGGDVNMPLRRSESIPEEDRVFTGNATARSRERRARTELASVTDRYRTVGRHH